MRNKKEQSEKRPRALKFATIVSIIFLVCAWAFREPLGFEPSSLYVLSGIILFIVVVSGQNRKKASQIGISNKHLEQNREMIGTTDYNSD